MTTRRELIEQSIADLAKDFLYYDRKEDDELPVGAIQEAIREGELTVEEIVDQFRAEVNIGLHLWAKR